MFDINLEKLTLSLAFERVSLKIVDKHVFKKLILIVIHGVIESIDEDMFIHFKKLRLIYINSNNFRSLFHQKGGIKWINAINDDMNVNLTSANLKPYFDRIVTLEFHDQAQLFKQIYMYPNEDICLFKEFPNQQLVYPAIMLEEKFECTCTLLWLTRFYKSYIHVPKYFFEPISFKGLTTVEEYCSKLNNLTTIFRACNFTKMLENCESKR